MTDWVDRRTDGAVDRGAVALGSDGPRILDDLAAAVEAFNRGDEPALAWDDLLFDDVDGDWRSPQIVLVAPAGDLTELSPVLEAITVMSSTAAAMA